MWNECPKKYFYKYVRKERTHNGIANLQGLSLHEIALEEYMGQGGVQDVDALVELIAMDFVSRCESGDPRDYNTKEPVTEGDILQATEQLKVWSKGFLNAVKDGKDPYGEPFQLPDVKATEVELCRELELSDGTMIRIRGFADFIFDDESLGDLKLASDYFRAVWTEARALSEVQPVMYAKMHGTDTFRYVIVDKKKARHGDAYSPNVRIIEVKLTEKHFNRLMENIEYFVANTDVLNDHENGVFPCRPLYGGETKAKAGMTEKNFCDQMCGFKEICFKENFSVD
tara:strand:- start:119 stop:973 length:855 start_codon:yes stop_codon:yes gene_type:complete